MKVRLLTAIAALILLILDGAAIGTCHAVTLTVGDEPKQVMRYGMDYERLWFWYGPQANLNTVAQWSVVDCDLDYLRVAINCAYELTEGDYDLRAYTQKIIPMMTAMKAANPNIKFFGSPRPLNEAISGARWQPYPRWITGDNGSSFSFNWQKCAEYLTRYVQLMKSYGFTIHYLDVSNEWNFITPTHADNIKNHLAAALGADMPIIVANSAWSFSQGRNWLNSAISQGKTNGFDIAACHNTGKEGTPADFASTALSMGKEVWDSEVHGWKGKEISEELPTSFEMFDRIRAGFSGLDTWLAIGTPTQNHCMILNNGSSVVRNVKYHIFRKLTTTSNRGYALDINQPTELTSTVALVRDNLLTVWILNNSDTDVPVDLNTTGHAITDPTIQRTEWNESLSIEGVSDQINATSANLLSTTIKAGSLYCYEIVVNTGSTRPTVIPDTTYTTRNHSVSIDVLANEMELNVNPLTVVAFTQGANGSVMNNGGGILNYTPAANFTGTDRFAYVVRDSQTGAINRTNVTVLVYPSGTGPYWTNVQATAEAVVRGGSHAADDQDEIAAGYLSVKYHGSNNDFSRKAYFQFDLSGMDVLTSTQAVFAIGFRNAYTQNVQAWALDQPYNDFTSAINWNVAQANDLNGNNLISSGLFTATRIGSVTNLPASGTAPQEWAISEAGRFIQNQKMTLAITGAPETEGYVNHSSGLRLLRETATLQVLVLPPVPPPSNNAPVITSVSQSANGSTRLIVQGEAGILYHVQAAETPTGNPWVNISTNIAGSSGRWIINERVLPIPRARFYRALRP